MDEEKIQQGRRQHDEDATRERAAILALQYLDTREIENNLALTEGMLTIQEMYSGHIIPLIQGSRDTNDPSRFGVTSQTPQSLIQSMTVAYGERGEPIQFFLISGSGFKAFMHRYDPPVEVI